MFDTLAGATDFRTSTFRCRQFFENQFQPNGRLRRVAGADSRAGVKNAGRSAPSAPPRVPMVAPTQLAATMEEAWAALNENNPGKNGAAIEKLWFETIAKLFPHKSNTDLKVHEWGKLKAEFEKDELPM